MIRLFDLGAEFWKNFYGAGESAIKAYDLTLERILWYWRDSKRMVVCCDHPVNHRLTISPEYKAKRKPKPREAIESLVSVEERVRFWGCPTVSVEGFEADDVIATLVDQAYPEEVEVIGTEKDFYCLISDNVKLVGRQGSVSFAECVEKWGVPPEQMSDLLALCGDASDNIKGCEHCGPGRAAKLLEQYGSIDVIQAAARAGIISIPGIGPKTVESLKAWDATQAVELVRLRRDVPVDLFSILPSQEAA